MIKTISHFLSFARTSNLRGVMTFCTKKVEKKSAEITKSFTDKAIEESK